MTRREISGAEGGWRSDENAAVSRNQFYKSLQVDGLAKKEADTQPVAFRYRMRRGEGGENEDGGTLFRRQIVQLLEQREGVDAGNHQINQQGVRLFV